MRRMFFGGNGWAIILKDNEVSFRDIGMVDRHGYIRQEIEPLIRGNKIPTLEEVELAMERAKNKKALYHKMKREVFELFKQKE